VNQNYMNSVALECAFLAQTFGSAPFVIQVSLVMTTPEKDLALHDSAAAHAPTANDARTAPGNFRPKSVNDVLSAHFDYFSYLFQKLEPLTGLEASEFSFRDHLQLPLQPLAENLESAIYETFERDTPKYRFYQEALRQALHDKAFSMESSSNSGATEPIIVMVLGAGRGPLVDAALDAADAVGAWVTVWAVEKNPSAVAVLRRRLKVEPTWRGRVRLQAADMRVWAPEHKADVIVRCFTL
jgi:type II protein arginine methyltransferase